MKFPKLAWYHRFALAVAAAVLAVLPSSLWAQASQPNNFPGGKGDCVATVATLSSKCGTTKGTIASVTDGTSPADCTTGGSSSTAVCQYSGSSWGAVTGSSAISGLTGGIAGATVATSTSSAGQADQICLDSNAGYAGADWSAMTKAALESTVNSVANGHCVDARAFQAATLAAANAPFGSSDHGYIFLPQATIQAQNTWILPAHLILEGINTFDTVIQAQNAGTAGTAVPVLQLGNAGLTQGNFIKKLAVDGNSLAGTVGIRSYVGQEQSGGDQIVIQNTTVAGLQVGTGAGLSQHGGAFSNINIGAAVGSGASCGGSGSPDLYQQALTGTGPGSIAWGVTSGGLVSIYLASTTGAFVGQGIWIDSATAGGTHATNINGPWLISAITTNTSISFQTAISAADSSTTVTGHASTYVTQAQFQAGTTAMRPVSNMTVSGTNCTNIFPTGTTTTPGWAAIEASGIGGITLVNPHAEGVYAGVDVGGYAATANVKIQGGDFESGSTVTGSWPTGTGNAVVTAVQISNAFCPVTDFDDEMQEATGAGAGPGPPTDLIVDLCNGNVITYANNKRALFYRLDGAGFPHAMLANCADMTKGWCDDGTTNSLYASGAKVFSINATSGNVIAGSGSFTGAITSNSATNVCGSSSPCIGGVEGATGPTATATEDFLFMSSSAHAFEMSVNGSTLEPVPALNGSFGANGDVMTAHAALGSGNAWDVADSGTLLSSLAPNASPTLTGTTTLATLAATTINGAAFSGTFTGAPTFSGNIAFTGTPTFSNALALGSSTATTQTACDNSTKLATTAYTGIACNTVQTSGSPFSLTAQSQTQWNNTSGAYVWDLPATSSGLQVCIGNYKTVAHAISLVPPSGSTIYYKGVAGTTSSSTGIVSGGAAGDFICVEAVDSTTWEVIGAGQGVWTNN